MAALVLCFVFDAFDSDPDFNDFEEGSGLFGSDGDEDAFEVGIIVGLKEGMMLELKLVNLSLGGQGKDPSAMGLLQSMNLQQ